jgi:hypothetical protein
MNILHEKRRALGHHRPHFGGDSSTSSKTDIRDMRVVGGDNSTNLSANLGEKSTMNVQVTDHGAVSGGLALGTQAIDAAARSAEATAATGASMFEGAVAAVEKAYQSGQAGDQVQLKYAGFVVVGLAAVLLLPRIVKS